jgi:hypothetical protein
MTTNLQWIIWDKGSANANWACRFAVYVDSTAGINLSAVRHFALFRTNTQLRGTVALTTGTTPKLRLTIDGETDTDGTTDFPFDQWVVIETSWNSDTDSVEVKMDGTVEITRSVTTLPADVQEWRLTGFVAAETEIAAVYYDDVRIDNVATQIGDGKIVALYPSGVGSVYGDYVTGTYTDTDDWKTVSHDSDTTRGEITGGAGDASHDMDDPTTAGISSGDTINAVAAALIAKRGSGSTTTHTIEVLDEGGSPNGSDTPTLGAAYAGYQVFATTVPSYTNLASYEIGKKKTSGGREFYVTAEAFMVDYTPAGGAIKEGAVVIAAVGNLTPKGQLNAGGAAVLQGVGSETALGKRTRTTGGSLQGVGTMAGAATKERPGASSMSGVATLIPTGQGIFTDGIALAGAGSLSGIASPILAGVAAMSGVGTLTGDPAAIFGGVVTLDGVGTLSGIPARERAAILAMAGAGTLSGVGSLLARGVLVLSGTGTLAGTGQGIFGGALSAQGIATLTPTGTKTGILLGQVVFNAVGQLVVLGKPIFISTTSMAGVGNLIALAARERPGAVVMDGIGTLSGAVSRDRTSAISLDGMGILTLVGQGIFTDGISLTGAAALSGVASRERSALAAMAGVGILTPSGVGIFPNSITLDGAGALAGLASADRSGALSMSGVGNLIVIPARLRNGQLSINAAGNLILTGVKISSGIVSLDGTASLNVVAVRIIPGAVAMLGVSVLTAVGTVELGVPLVSADFKNTELFIVKNIHSVQLRKPINTAQIKKAEKLLEVID